MTYNNGELQIGTLDKRQLHLRFFAPMNFCKYDGNGFKFSWLKLLNPFNWRLSLLKQCRFSVRRFTNLNHRCYCSVGCIIDINVVVLGFGVWSFYSYYGGPVPCSCDKIVTAIGDGCAGCHGDVPVWEMKEGADGLYCEECFQGGIPLRPRPSIITRSRAELRVVTNLES